MVDFNKALADGSSASAPVVQQAPSRPSWSRRMVGFDTETTGTDDKARIIEFGAVVWEDGLVVASMSWLLNPGPVDMQDPNIRRAFEVNQIDPAKLAGQPTYAQAFEEIKLALGQADVRVAHNAPFDQRMLRQEFARAVAEGTLKPEHSKGPSGAFTLDTLAIDLCLRPDARGRNLDATAGRWGVSGWTAHRAAGDAEAAVRIMHAMALELGHLSVEQLKAQQLKSQAKWKAIVDRMRARDAGRQG